MDSTNHDPQKQLGDGVLFLQTLFAPSDRICFRPVKTWNEGGKRRSRVDYEGVRYWCGGMTDENDQWVWDPPGTAVSLDTRLTEMKARAEQERTNVFFGVCPRHGPKQYDQAWQIRIVRVLWADIDHTTVDEALERCRTAGLPPPSIVVNSGHGVHLYWFLVEPYLIDDAGGNEPCCVRWSSAIRAVAIRLTTSPSMWKPRHKRHTKNKSPRSSAETATYNPNDEEFEKRLGAIVRRGVTTIIIDNAKGRQASANRIGLPGAVDHRSDPLVPAAGLLTGNPPL